MAYQDQYNDAKKVSLEALLLTDKLQIDDAERDYLLTLVANVQGNHINDLWMEYFKFKGFDRGDWNDSAYAWLESLGLSGHINDMWYFLWRYLGGQEPSVEPYQFEMPDTSIQDYEFDLNGVYLIQIPVVL